jgi:hypothetical protein
LLLLEMLVLLLKIVLHSFWSCIAMKIVLLLPESARVAAEGTAQSTADHAQAFCELP